MDEPAAEPLLDIRDLSVSFGTTRGVVRAVRGLDLAVPAARTVALVGESGCGKSVTAHAITRLIPMPPGRIDGGRVLFRGTDLLALPERDMRLYRGSHISMVFQEPMTSLNPVFKVGEQIADVVRVHERCGRAAAFERAVRLLDLVKIPVPERRAHAYPHQLSGGMRQRVMIAMALASPEPGLLIADEPTTALDVTIQAQILELLKDLQNRVRVSILLITHDMGVVAENADRVVVMYAGRKVEEGDAPAVIKRSAHPYTRGLLASLPSNPRSAGASRLQTIRGTVPDMIGMDEGCPFRARCPEALPACAASFPAAGEVEPDHRVWCHALRGDRT